ncbi:hypothetical protein Pmar_PMAR018472 [Perkinsus marinus ATCC 50983]|uniref:Uncharacterized protein n=1 Tax=Perkinsus marinus (strain ATCC 50983 / TXsc) TaxID=423536 RepID=C5KZX3_PERM5|nr:hypothetical protein Pmar_PMAR018472 [Perkinsus marinus ATCC 50983]EER09831.1 hypothetical protein Pmar_PMAR018472 [Perkinsus marinus ATCC 50983]|eukprot:XP_002778036.1 hypothetical protein Pmar_PMAR018472 [Perkinsus marinus ATCC 50983]
MATSGLFIAVTLLLSVEVHTWTSEIPVRPGMTWEEQASYYAYHDRCDLGTTESVKIMIKFRKYVITNCDRKGRNSFRTIGYVPNNLDIPGPHNKEWCIQYFRAVGFLPGKSLDWARKTMCDANYFRSGKWKEPKGDRADEDVANKLAKGEGFIGCRKFMKASFAKQIRRLITVGRRAKTSA